MTDRRQCLRPTDRFPITGGGVVGRPEEAAHKRIHNRFSDRFSGHDRLPLVENLQGTSGVFYGHMPGSFNTTLYNRRRSRRPVCPLGQERAELCRSLGKGELTSGGGGVCIWTWIAVDKELLCSFVLGVAGKRDLWTGCICGKEIYPSTKPFQTMVLVFQCM